MGTPTRDELRKWTAALTLGPLDVGDPHETRYVELADAGRSAVADLQGMIEAGLETTTQLLAGPRGAGKTTELYRLRRDLDTAGYQATVVPITDYVSQSSPIGITSFLIALALGTRDALVADPSHRDRPGFVGRLGGLLRRLNIAIDIGGVTAGLSRDSIEVGALGSKLSIDLRAELKSSKRFVDELEDKLSHHVAPLYDEVARYLCDLLPSPDSDRDQGSVLIVDTLDGLRGTSANDSDVQSSVEALFVQNAHLLRFSSHHVVYTVPTYLQFTSPGALPYPRRFVPVPHVNSRGGGTDARAAQNLTELREVVARRIPVERIFADDRLLDMVIDSSGGHLRDLFRILQDLIRLTWQLSLPLPVEREHVEEAIRPLAREFATMTAEQAAFLRAVASGTGIHWPAADEVQLMARLVQGHMLLGHVNGEDWYEVHPLARRALGLP